MRLYELTSRYNQIADLAFEEADSDGAIDKALANMLDLLEDGIDAKLSGICRVIKGLEAVEAAAKAEADRITQKRKAAERHIERLKAYAKWNLEELGETKRKVDEIFTVAIQANPPSVRVVNLDSVPHDFDKPVERSLDVSRIRDILKNGDEVPGCELIRGTHLRIR